MKPNRGPQKVKSTLAPLPFQPETGVDVAQQLSHALMKVVRSAMLKTQYGLMNAERGLGNEPWEFESIARALRSILNLAECIDLELHPHATERTS